MFSEYFTIHAKISVNLQTIPVRLRPSAMTAAISTGDNKSGSAAAAIKLVSRRVRDRAKVKLIGNRGGRRRGGGRGDVRERATAGKGGNKFVYFDFEV